MTQVIKLHAGGRKLIVCRGQEGKSLYCSLSSHNRLLYYPRVHFHLDCQLQPLSQGKIPAKISLCSILLYAMLHIFYVTIYFLSITNNIRQLHI